MKIINILAQKSSGRTLGFSVTAIIFLSISLLTFISCQNDPPVYPLQNILISDTTIVMQADSISQATHDYDVESSYYLYAGNYDSLESSIFLKFTDFNNMPDIETIDIRKVILRLSFQNNYFRSNINSPSSENQDEIENVENKNMAILKISAVRDEYFNWDQESADTSLLSLNTKLLTFRRYNPENYEQWQEYHLPDSVLLNWIADTASNQGLRVDILPENCQIIQKINSRNTNEAPYIMVEYSPQDDSSKVYYSNIYPTMDLNVAVDSKTEPNDQIFMSAYSGKSIKMRIPWESDKDNYYIHRAFLHLYQDTLRNRFFENTLEFRMVYLGDDSSRYLLKSDNVIVFNKSSEIRIDITNYIQRRTVETFTDPFIFLEVNEYSDIFSRLYLLKSDSLKPYLEVHLIDEYPSNP